MVNQFEEIIEGSLLGDGYISKQGAFSKSQCEKRIEYLQWHFDKLKPYSSRLKTYNNKCNGKVYRKSVYATTNSFLELREKWYPNGLKIVPKDIKLNPLSLSIWFCDDGTNSLKNRACSFATHCFSKDDCLFLSHKLKEIYNLNSYITKKNVLTISSFSYKDFIDLIKPCVFWKCFNYKLVYREPRTDRTKDNYWHQYADDMLIDYNNGLTQYEIGLKYGCLVGMVSNVLRKRCESKLALNNSTGIKNLFWDKNRNQWMVSKTKNKKRAFRRFKNIDDAIFYLNST